ncbi:MAG TPA: sensor histidine kinase [Vicinamibacterales bacterium]|jgi:signal transduction histidine kinase
MRFRTWPVAALGLGGLLLLVVVSVMAASNRAQQIYSRLDQLNTHHREVETKLRRLRSDLHLSGIYIRDYLLDPERERASEYRAQLAKFRESHETTVAELRDLMTPDMANDERIVNLDAKLDDYWQTFDPLFDWTPSEKMLLSSGFLKREVLPRREAVLAIASEIEALNNANHGIQRAEINRQYAEFRGELQKLLWGSLLLGLIVAMTAVIRLRVLERRSERERSVIEEAERQMRQLSQQLVATQEEERKKLSRELHDHVGQMLTALRMELGRIDRLRSADKSEPRVSGAVAECRQLVDNMVRTVRDLALGLRPSMLDDFGLQPALEWHVRDFGRRYGVPVELVMTGEFDRLTDQHRTCVYRAVQEAMTNCVRHARAHQIDVTVTDEAHGLTVSVRDDGIGIDPARKADGLGLRGIEERVRELGGTIEIRSAAGGGTTLKIRVPLPPRETEVLRARAAG